MGVRGPVPKRSDKRHGHRSLADREVTRSIVATPPPLVPVGDADWHPIAARWFASLADSGQSEFYEASDWAHAEFVAEAMSRNLANGRFSAQLFAAVLSGMTDLLTTEGARRRARFEIERELPAGGADVIDYRARVSAGS